MKPFTAATLLAPALIHGPVNARLNIRRLITVVTLLCLPSVGFSETKEIVAEGAYHMGDGETPSVAESRALLRAKRVAVEQAGTYVESYSKVKHLQLTEDEIQVLASGLMEVTILDKKRSIAGDGFNFSVKIRAIVHPDKVEEMVKRVKEKSIAGDYKKVQEAYDNSQKEIEVLKRQLARAKTEQEKAKVEARITDEERSFQANEWLEKGEQAWLNDQADAAIEAYTKAIGLSPNHAKAYYLRGAAYNAKKQSEKAMLDCQKACQLGDQGGCYLLETTLKIKMLLEWDPLKAPAGFDFNKEYEKELKKRKQGN
ncbi:MAG: hypothetical protein KGO52_02910 [Nitrospirota bacterium]|nr:hypothetical protein [Nitrospirota bacterium]MDE3119606.1 hypothetical protein [Nitrospirota bacterium]MDE3241654.1 hypothetical protein [Nitrospirota bacterium]